MKWRDAWSKEFASPAWTEALGQSFLDQCKVPIVAGLVWVCVLMSYCAGLEEEAAMEKYDLVLKDKPIKET